MAMKRININLDEELLNRIDEYAEEMYTNRTSAITFLLVTALKSNDIVKGYAALTELAKTEE